MFNTISLIVDFTKDTQKGKEKHASYLCTVLHLIPGSSCQRHAHVMLWWNPIHDIHLDTADHKRI